MSPELLALLCCPVDGQSLIQEGDSLVCAHHHRYLIEEEIVRLVPEAQASEEDKG